MKNLTPKLQTLVDTLIDKEIAFDLATHEVAATEYVELDIPEIMILDSIPSTVDDSVNALIEDAERASECYRVYPDDHTFVAGIHLANGGIVTASMSTQPDSFAWTPNFQYDEDGGFWLSPDINADADEYISWGIAGNVLELEFPIDQHGFIEHDISSFSHYSGSAITTLISEQQSVLVSEHYECAVVRLAKDYRFKLFKRLDLDSCMEGIEAYFEDVENLLVDSRSDFSGSQFHKFEQRFLYLQAVLDAIDECNKPSAKRNETLAILGSAFYSREQLGQVLHKTKLLYGDVTDALGQTTIAEAV